MLLKKRQHIPFEQRKIAISPQFKHRFPLPPCIYLNFQKYCHSIIAIETKGTLMTSIHQLSALIIWAVAADLIVNLWKN
jgi:hypothetical protein